MVKSSILFNVFLQRYLLMSAVVFNKTLKDKEIKHNLSLNPHFSGDFLRGRGWWNDPYYHLSDIKVRQEE